MTGDVRVEGVERGCRDEPRVRASKAMAGEDALHIDVLEAAPGGGDRRLDDVVEGDDPLVHQRLHGTGLRCIEKAVDSP